MNKYSKVKTSEWYVHKTKRKVALAKINNSKVKFVSKAWPNNKGYSVSKSKTKIETTMNMNGDVYEVGAGSDNSGNVLIGGMSKAGLNKDKNYVRVKKKLDSLLVEMKQKKQKNQSFKKEEGEYLKLMDEERKIIDQYSIMQECSQPVKVK